MSEILYASGEVVNLAEWQKRQHFTTMQLGRWFFLDEPKISEFVPFVYASELIILMDAYRKAKGEPVIVNSAFRTREKQLQLIKAGYRAAKVSPHEQGMAFDIHSPQSQTMNNVVLLRQVASDLGYKIRLGYLTYNYQFIHVDVCPMYYGEGCIRHDEEHPFQWDYSIEW